MALENVYVSLGKEPKGGFKYIKRYFLYENVESKRVIYGIKFYKHL